MTDDSKAVFLSYASQDAETARRIADALRSAGVEVWFDQSELRGGDAWDQQIRRQIKDCALFVPVVSANTDVRTEGYFRLEWKLAVDRSHLMADDAAFLVPVVIDGTPEATARVPDKFRAVQWTRLPGGTTPPEFIERVARLMSPAQNVSAVRGSKAAATATASKNSAGHPQRPRWMRPTLLLIVVAAAVAAGYVAVDKFWLLKAAADSGRVSLSPAQSLVTAQSTIPEKSIAVLPFIDLSEKKDQEYFSDGLSEELIDLLTKVPDLRVPARTSSFYFKGKSEDIATIAEKLQVAHVLEGSVRKAGNTIRVTAELVRADNGYHLWSESYERDLKDVFKVQDEIAGAVVSALKLKLPPGQQMANARRTSNTEA
jgi:TolB-like protein